MISTRSDLDRKTQFVGVLLVRGNLSGFGQDIIHSKALGEFLEYLKRAWIGVGNKITGDIDLPIYHRLADFLDTSLSFRHRLPD